MPELSVLAPANSGTKQEKLIRHQLRDVISKVVVNIAIHRRHSDLLEEVYLAGLWHGMKLSQPERQRDYLVMERS